MGEKGRTYGAGVWGAYYGGQVLMIWFGGLRVTFWIILGSEELEMKMFKRMEL